MTSSIRRPSLITVLAIIAIYLALALTILAVTRSRPWLMAPATGLLALVIVLAVIAPGQTPTAGWFVVVMGIGIGGLGVLGGSPLVGLILKLAQGGVVLGVHGGIVVDDDGSPRREILRGGATIGHLERLALLGSVAAGQPAAVAVIVAIKGLGRFAELDDSAARERFIIGTLASLSWAGGCASVALLLARPALG